MTQTQKEGWLTSKLKNAGIIVDDPKEIAKAAPIAPKPSSFTSTDTFAMKTSSAFQEVTEDPAIQQALEGAMQNKTLQNTYDYIKFKKAVDLYQKRSGMTEKQAYSNALIGAETAGSNKQTVIDTAQSYIAVLDSEKRQFDQAMLDHSKEEITTKEQATAKLSSRINDDLQEITRLTKQVESSKVALKDAEADLAQAKAKLETKTATFMLTYNRLKNNILSDIDKLKEVQ